MSTTLGEIQIDELQESDGVMFVRGRFKSLAEENVYRATNDFGVTVMLEAIETLGITDRSLAQLRAAIDNVSFETPNKKATNFKLCLADMDLARRLRPVAWESFRLG
jgi:hypothetical protein